jgi:hypothetical protein
MVILATPPHLLKIRSGNPRVLLTLLGGGGDTESEDGDDGVVETEGVVSIFFFCSLILHVQQKIEVFLLIHEMEMNIRLFHPLCAWNWSQEN